jgi:hypothetical protein
MDLIPVLSEKEILKVRISDIARGKKHPTTFVPIHVCFHADDGTAGAKDTRCED